MSRSVERRDVSGMGQGLYDSVTLAWFRWDIRLIRERTQYIYDTTRTPYNVLSTKDAIFNRDGDGDGDGGGCLWHLGYLGTVQTGDCLYMATDVLITDMPMV